MCKSIVNVVADGNIANGTVKAVTGRSCEGSTKGNVCAQMLFLSKKIF